MMYTVLVSVLRPVAEGTAEGRNIASEIGLRWVSVVSVRGEVVQLGREQDQNV